jgi:hypothetical protein
MASELEAQQLVHSLEHGKGKWWIWLLVAIFGTAALFIVHIWINPLNQQGGQSPFFRGLTDARGMEQAVIARELSRGNGFKTKVISPAAIDLMEKKKGERAFDAVIKYDADAGFETVPDYHHAPLWPWINSLMFRSAVSLNDSIKWRTDEDGRPNYWKLQKTEEIHPADRLIATMAAVLMILGIIVNYFTGTLLFDQRLSVFCAGLCLLCEYLWEICFTGQPQMLLFFLFSCAMHCFVRALLAKQEGRGTLLWNSLAGVFLGLMTLAHMISLWVVVGALIWVAFAFRPKFTEPAVILAIVLAFCVPWFVRTAGVCGDFQGTAKLVSQFQIRGTESQIMRQLGKPDESIEPLHRRAKLQTQVEMQAGGIVNHLGGIIAAPLFFLALLHIFKRPEVAAFRWGIFWMWMFAILGMAFLGLDGSAHHPSDIYLLFIPFATFYGLGLILMMWSRLEINIRILNILLALIPFVVSVMPMVRAFTDPPKMHVIFPPYYPRVISGLGEWFDQRDIICTDMPWATAWYADRNSLWLPQTITDFNELNDFRFSGRVTGLFLTPESGYKGLLNVVAGEGSEYREWSQFIMRIPRANSNFPLKAALPLPPRAQYILFADRDRWTQRND